MIIKKNNRIGIWGFGVVGKAVINFLHTQGYQLGLMDKRTPTTQDRDSLKEKILRDTMKRNKNHFFILMKSLR